VTPRRAVQQSLLRGDVSVTDLAEPRSRVTFSAVSAASCAESSISQVQWHEDPPAASRGRCRAGPACRPSSRGRCIPPPCRGAAPGGAPTGRSTPTDVGFDALLAVSKSPAGSNVWQKHEADHQCPETKHHCQACHAQQHNSVRDKASPNVATGCNTVGPVQLSPSPLCPLASPCGPHLDKQLDLRCERPRRWGAGDAAAGFEQAEPAPEMFLQPGAQAVGMCHPVDVLHQSSNRTAPM